MCIRDRPRHLLAENHQVLRLEALSELPLLLPNARSGLGKMLQKLFEYYDIVPPSVRRLDANNALYSLAAVSYTHLDVYKRQHYILGMKAYNDMPQTSLKFIIAKYRWLYQLGLQGPDIFFYNLPILRHRDHRNVGSHMHEHLVNRFFRVSFENLTKIESRPVSYTHLPR